jgi:hypothetical protein
MRAMRFVPGVATVFGLLVLPGCQAEAPPQGLEATCAKACEVHAQQCSSHQCGRGCNLVLDRLAQDEGNHVIDCVARAGRACDDHAWAACATRIGPHADGGPPAPPPPHDIADDPGD